MMKKATLCTAVMVVAGFFLYIAPSHAQRNLALYSMPGLQQASYANPSFIPDASLVIGLPFLSNVNAGYSNSGLSLKDMGAGGWNLDGIRLNYEKMLPLIEKENIAGGGLNTNLFTIGFRLKNQYFAFESSEQVVGTFYYPEAAIQFGADINSRKNEPGLGQSYNLNGLAYDLTHFRNFSLTYAREFGRASAGMRLRYLVGLQNYSSSGSGVTLASTDATGMYEVLGRFELWAAGVQSLSSRGGSPFEGQGNQGFAFDFGTTYALGDKFTASFSVLNVGGVEWSSGVRRKVIQTELQSPETEIDRVFHSFIYDAPSPNLSYNTTLPTFVYLGGAYQVNDKSTFNLLLNSRYMQSRHSLAAALSYSRKFSRGLQASLTYSAINGSILNLGGGLAFKAGPFQFFGVTDNLFSVFTPLSSKNIHVNFGVNLAFYQKDKTAVALADTAAFANPLDSTALAIALEDNPGQNTTQPVPSQQDRPAQAVPQPPPPQQNKPVQSTPLPASPQQNRPAQSNPQPATTQAEKPAQNNPQPATTQAEKPAQNNPQPATTQAEKPAQNNPQPATTQAEKPAQNNPQPATTQAEKPAEEDPKPAPSQQNRPAQPAAPAVKQEKERPAGASRYTVMQGSIHLESRPEKVSHHYFDVYKIHPDGQRELVRTGRVPGGDYKLYLDRAYDHEISFRHSESAPLVIEVESEALENAGPNITRNVTLKRASPPEEKDKSNQELPEETEEPEVEDLMELSVPELRQEEAEVLQRKVPQEETTGLWVDQPARSLRLKQDISIYKDMDAGSRVIARLSTGMEIEVLERTTAEWWMVAYRSKIGWVETSMLK